MDTLTQVVGGAVEAVALSGEIIRFLAALQAANGSPEQVIQLLQDHLVHPDPRSPISLLMTQLGVDPTPLQKLFDKNQERVEILLLLFQPVPRFGAHTLSYPLSGTGAPATGLTLQGTAALAASVEAAADGDLLNGMVSFDKDREAFLCVGVEGTLRGAADGAAPLGSVAVEGAFTAGSTVKIENFFRHAAGDITLAALAADIPLFTLPGRLGAQGGTVLRAGQLVRLSGTGSIKLGGSVQWSRNFLSTANVTPKSLQLDTHVEILTGLAAEGSFSYALEGTFDILLSAAAGDAAKVRIRLAKSRTSTRQVGLEVSAGVGIEGLDRAGKAVLDRFLPKLGALIEQINAAGDRYAELGRLFLATPDEQVEAALGRREVTQQIEALLFEIQANPELKAKLKELANEASLAVTGAQIDALESNLGPVVNAFKDLIRKYLATVERIHAAMQQAAHVKIGLAAHLARKRVETAAVALDLEIDPRRDHDLYRRILQGDFAAAVAASRDPASSVGNLSGALKEGGALTRTADFTFTALGDFQLDQASILSQTWEAVISPSGDITIGVSGEVTASTRLLHEMRTATFLADSRVIALLLDDQNDKNDQNGQSGAVSGPRFEQKVSLELTHELTPARDSEVADEEQTLRRLGVLTEPASLVKDLVLQPQKPQQKFGTLVSSAVLELGRRDLQALLSAPSEEAQKELILGLIDDYGGGHRWLPWQDGHGKPFLLWRSVRGQFLGRPVQPAGDLAFPPDDGGARSRSLDPAEQTVLAFYVRMVDEFRRLLAGLGQVAAEGPVPGETRDRLLGRVRSHQLQLLQVVDALIAPPVLLDRHKIAQALFRTLFRLTRAHGGTPEPHVTIQRKNDGKMFVYG